MQVGQEDEAPIWGLSGNQLDAFSALLMALVLDKSGLELDQYRKDIPVPLSDYEWANIKRRFATEAVRAHRKVHGNRCKYTKATRLVQGERVGLRVNENGKLEHKKG